MRNAPCPCGSGEKYKRCCGAAGGQPTASGPQAAAAGSPIAQTQFLRGVQLLRSGQNAAAISTLRAAIRADNKHFDAHHALGSAFAQAGQFAQATEILRRAVALRPDSAAAHRDLGGAYDCQDMHEAAIAAYRKAVERAPNLAGAHCRLGELLKMYGRMQEAADCFDRAADATRNAMDARMFRSDAQLLRGDIKAAEKWARQAVALEPASNAANGTLAGVLYVQGRFEEAATYFETALRQYPKSAKCWDGLVHCKKYAVTDNAILDRMRAVLRHDDLPDRERMTMHFAMGKVHDDCGDYAEAMEQFDTANRLRAHTHQFDRAGFAARVDMNIQLFTPDFLARNAAFGATDQTPIFIVGMPRSGTTLTEQVLSSHPDIAAGGELTVWAPGDFEIDPAVGAFDPDRARAATGRYLSVLQQISPSAARVTDKLPFNLFHLGAIHTLLPKARIIHCQRDPIDTCLSIYTNIFSSRVNFAARRDDLVFCYQQYLRMMDHWRRLLPAGIFLEVQYERLISDREAETRRLISFAGLDWDDRCLQPERNTRAIGTASAWQARQPVYTTSVQRWRRYEPWIGELRQLAQLPS
jgi:tetratricopeptide (TPR) repeat protein